MPPSLLTHVRLMSVSSLHSTCPPSFWTALPPHRHILPLLHQSCLGLNSTLGSPEHFLSDMTPSLTWLLFYLHSARDTCGSLRLCSLHTVAVCSKHTLKKWMGPGPVLDSLDRYKDRLLSPLAGLIWPLPSSLPWVPGSCMFHNATHREG